MIKYIFQGLYLTESIFAILFPKTVTKVSITMDNAYTLLITVHLRSEFGNAMSYRQLKRENVDAAVLWKQTVASLKTSMKELEDTFANEGGFNSMEGLQSLTDAAAKLQAFNKVTGMKACNQMILKSPGGTKLMTITSNP